MFNTSIYHLYTCTIEYALILILILRMFSCPNWLGQALFIVKLAGKPAFGGLPCSGAPMTAAAQ